METRTIKYFVFNTKTNKRIGNMYKVLDNAMTVLQDTIQFWWQDTQNYDIIKDLEIRQTEVVKTYDDVGVKVNTGVGIWEQHRDEINSYTQKQIDNMSKTQYIAFVQKRKFVKYLEEENLLQKL